MILPGKSAESLLVKMIGGQIEGKRMPMTGDPLSDEQIGFIRRWIDDGARGPKIPQPLPSRTKSTGPTFLLFDPRFRT